MVVRRDIIVVGASSGGVEALRYLVAKLPAGIEAAIFIVQHTGARSPGVLGEILARAGRLPARLVHGTEPLAFGEIRVAPPNHHIVLTTQGVQVDRGPIENHVRPSIDVLFRSAADVFGPRVVGVVLTGNLDDGSAGLRAIKQKGGMTLVQSPETAAFPDMPRNAIRHGPPDVIGDLDDIAATLVAVAAEHGVAGETACARSDRATSDPQSGERTTP